MQPIEQEQGVREESLLLLADVLRISSGSPYDSLSRMFNFVVKKDEQEQKL